MTSPRQDGRTPRSPLLLLFLTITLDLIGFGMVMPLMPLYAERLAVSGQAIAWLMSSYSLMQFVFAPVWGRLSDRIGRRRVLIVSIFANAACLFAFAESTSYWQLLISRIGAGICTANMSVAVAYVADVTSLRARARGMGVVGAGFGIGFVIGPFLAGELSPFGLEMPALVAGGLSLVNGLLALLLLPESLPQSRRAALASRTPWYEERWHLLLGTPKQRPLYGIVFLQTMGFAMMELALALYCEHRFAMRASDTGRLLALVGVVMVVVQGGLIGLLVRRFGEARLLSAGLTALALSLALLPRLAELGEGPFICMMAAVAAAQAVVSPTINGLISKDASAETQGIALGLAQSASALARTLGPAVAGLLLDRNGLASPFFGAGGIVAVGALLALWRSLAAPRGAAPWPAGGSPR